MIMIIFEKIISVKGVKNIKIVSPQVTLSSRALSGTGGVTENIDDPQEGFSPPLVAGYCPDLS